MIVKIQEKYLNEFINTYLIEEYNGTLPILNTNNTNPVFKTSALINEFDENLEKSFFDSESTKLKYLNRSINKLLSYRLNINYLLIELEFLSNFLHEYEEKILNDKISLITYGRIYSKSTFTSNIETLKYKFYRNLSIDVVTSHLLDKKVEILTLSKTEFNFESSDEFLSLISIKQICETIKSILNDNYPQFKLDVFDSIPPIYFYKFKNEIYLKLKSDFIKHEQIIKNKNNFIDIIKLILKEINTSNILTQEVFVKRLYSESKYLDSSINELLTSNDPIKHAKESNNPNLMFLTLTNFDFNRYFKYKNINLEKYNKKREDYINLFKYEMISDFYTIVLSYIPLEQIDEIIPDKGGLIVAKSNLEKPQKETLNDKSKYYHIFDEDRIDEFEKCYNEYSNEKNLVICFSAIFFILKEVGVIHEYVGNKEFIAFIKNYSNDKIMLTQLKSKGVINYSPTFKRVRTFINQFGKKIQ